MLPTHLAKGLTRLKNNGMYTDLTIICQGKEFRVHKAVVCAYSDAIHAACQSNCKDAGISFTIDEYDLEVVENMIEFFYSGKYGAEKSVAYPNRLSLHAWMFSLADKYIIPDLGEYALMHYGTDGLGKDQFPDFLKSARIAYESTPASETRFRKAVCSLALNRFEISFASEAHADEVNSLVMDVPEFMLQLFQANVTGRTSWGACDALFVVNGGEN